MPGFRVEDWTDAYANAPNIPNGESWPAAWVKPSELFRKEHHERSELNIKHGDDEREAFDLFLPKAEPRGLFVFVHGGFWIRLDKSYWSHLSAGALQRGWAVAMPSYPLCPQVRVRDIAPSVSKAIVAAGEKVPGPIRLCGHSAGGQIVTRLVSQGTALPNETLSRIEKVVSLSGVHDLRPLLKTALNDTIQLDEKEADTESPALLKPAIDVSLTCWVGANERSEFVRQNALLANIWRGLGLSSEAIEEPDRNHFDVVDGLASPDTPLVKNIFEEL